MIVGQRIKARLPLVPLTQAELARRVGMSQSGMVNLIAGRSRTTSYLHKIARELRTTPAFLSGETDDPDTDAPPPVVTPTVQLVTIKAALPSEPALVEAYRALLSICRDMDEDELAHELAKRLPTVLRVAGDAIVVPASDDLADLGEVEAAPGDAPPAPRRAARSR